MDETKRNFGLAKQHINKGHYNAARQILTRMNHPQARLWLHKLNEKEQKERHTRLLFFAAALVVVWLMVLGGFLLSRNQTTVSGVVSYPALENELILACMDVWGGSVRCRTYAETAVGQNREGVTTCRRRAENTEDMEVYWLRCVGELGFSLPLP